MLFSYAVSEYSSSKQNEIMQISKKLTGFVYFIFPFMNSLKNVLHFLYSKLMIALSVTCLIINNFFRKLENGKFSNLKLDVYIIIFIICSKYERQLVLINHSLLSSTKQGGWGLEFCLFSKK